DDTLDLISDAVFTTQLRRQRGESKAERVDPPLLTGRRRIGGRRLLGQAGLLGRLQLAELGGELLDLAVAPYLDADRLADLGLGDDARQFAHLGNLLAGEL